MKDFVLPFTELQEVPGSQFLQSDEVPPNGSTTHWHISHSSQFSVVCKLAEDTFCPIIQIINEEFKQVWIQCWSFWCTTSQWPRTRLCTTPDHPLVPAIQPIFNLPHCLLIHPWLLPLDEAVLTTSDDFLIPNVPGDSFQTYLPRDWGEAYQPVVPCTLLLALLEDRSWHLLSSSSQVLLSAVMIN